ncbi:MAG: protein kinase [Myxococcales bacterium]|nr:protein kinase [Myxococcales bacterium]MCB9520248.1 protein kinase [Myxococcales bacterium]MCB9531384.1 protein kinase [Myxococcales bacterium]MCB9533543.1 protein kinase [Myxococcales bacterium]
MTQTSGMIGGAATVREGAVIAGRYSIGRLLGRGGFGSVFAATDRNTGQDVAVKILDPRFAADPHLSARFRREVAIVARLKHPNTIRVFDFGWDDGASSLFLVMELLSGRSLADALARSGTLPEPRVRSIATQVLRSLEEAHRAGIVHRDLKPDNIFLCAYGDDEDFVKVLDFGIAEDSADEAEGLTRTGEIPCTPAYVAPERIQGLPASPASDLYSLGVLLVELLEGRPPIRGSLLEVAFAHARSDLPVPLAPQTAAGGLGSALARALERHPGDRFQTATEFREALTAPSGATTQAVPASPAYTATLASPTGAQPGVVTDPGGMVARDVRLRRLAVIVGVVAAVACVGLGLALLIDTPGDAASQAASHDQVAAPTPTQPAASRELAAPAATEVTPSPAAAVDPAEPPAVAPDQAAPEAAAAVDGEAQPSDSVAPSDAAPASAAEVPAPAAPTARPQRSARAARAATAPRETAAGGASAEEAEAAPTAPPATAAEPAGTPTPTEPARVNIQTPTIQIRP